MMCMILLSKSIPPPRIECDLPLPSGVYPEPVERDTLPKYDIEIWPGSNDRRSYLPSRTAAALFAARAVERAAPTYFSIIIAKNIVASFLPNSMKSFCFCCFYQRSKGYQAQTTHITTPMRKVPTNSGSGSFVEAVFKYPRIASSMFFSKAGKSGACV